MVDLYCMYSLCCNLRSTIATRYVNLLYNPVDSKEPSFEWSIFLSFQGSGENGFFNFSSYKRIQIIHKGTNDTDYCG